MSTRHERLTNALDIYGFVGTYSGRTWYCDGRWLVATEGEEPGVGPLIGGKTPNGKEFTEQRAVTAAAWVETPAASFALSVPVAAVGVETCRVCGMTGSVPCWRCNQTGRSRHDCGEVGCDFVHEGTCGACAGTKVRACDHDNHQEVAILGAPFNLNLLREVVRAIGPNDAFRLVVVEQLAGTSTVTNGPALALAGDGWRAVLMGLDRARLGYEVSTLPVWPPATTNPSPVMASVPNAHDSEGRY
jgi:hypothetical protein